MFPRIQPLGLDASSSLGRVYSRQTTASVNCEIYAVSFVMEYCPISTTFKNPASIHNLLNLSCCDNFSIRSPHFCNGRSLWAQSSLSKSTSVLITLGTSTALPQRIHRSIMKGFIFFTHFCDCSVKTELIYRSNCAKKTVSIVSKSAQQCIDNFPLPLLLSRPLDSGLVARKIGCPLSANVNIIFSAILSHSPCGPSSFVEYHFFSEPGPRKDQCPFPNLLAKRETSRAFDSHSILLSLDPHQMSLNIDMKMILPVKFSGVSFILNSKSLTS